MKGTRSTGGKAASETFDTEAFLTTVGAGRSVTRYKAKSYVFRQGGPCDAAFYIVEGQVAISRLQAG